MTKSGSLESLKAGRPGRLSEAMIRLFMKRAAVTGLEALGPGFRLLTLESSQFKGVAWRAGQKLQITIGSAFVSRTYTPIEWDAIQGQTRIIAYMHGSGPGSDWVRDVKCGDTCAVFGPRASLDVSGLHGPAVLFGDETSFGPAAAIARLGSVRYLFEVNSTQEAEPVLERFEIDKPELFTRRPDDEHLREIEEQIAGPAASGATFVLTGKATSIQRLRRLLKTLNVPSARVMTRAYWAPGKTGLD